MADAVEKTLSTTGMHCRSCALLIDMTVEELEGVLEVSTDYLSGNTTVVFDPDLVSVDEMISAIRSVGYDAEVR